MKFTLNHLHRNSATDRMPLLPRVAAFALAALITLPSTIPVVGALSENTVTEARHRLPPPSLESQTVLTESTAPLLSGVFQEDIQSDILTFSLKNPSDQPFNEISTEENREENTHPLPDTESVLDSEQPSAPEIDLFDPTLPLTQELIARRIESKMDMQARGGARVYYPYPAGAMAVDLYKDGKQILKGQVADIGGTVYVPVQRFADLFGSFKTVYTEATEQVVITGTNLSITVQVGDPYITVNERIFYTGKKVISLGGWIFVPLTSMSKAVNAKVTIRQGYYDAFITSGDPTKVQWASEYYDSTDLYWLSRIISAEAKGEPFAGQIAVGNVVLNRVKSSQFPSTVKGVIFDTKYGTQFSPVASGTIYNTPTASSIRAAKICLEGYSLSTKMIYFYNPSIATSSWIGRTRPYIMTIGNHKFYG
jgi:N-acetylmuramoyl-L-alanine amidase